MCQRLYLEVAVRLSVGGNLVPDMVFVFLDLPLGEIRQHLRLRKEAARQKVGCFYF